MAPLVDRDKLVWSADEKTSLFSTHFDAKQCRDSFQQLSLCQRNLLPRMLKTTGVSLLLPFYQRYLRRLWLRRCYFLESNSLLPPQFLYVRDLETCGALFTLFSPSTGSIGQGR